MRKGDKTQTRRYAREIRGFLRGVEQCLRDGDMMGARECAQYVAASAAELECIFFRPSEEVK